MSLVYIYIVCIMRRKRLGWMDGVQVALGNRGMMLETARQCAKDRKEWRALVVTRSCANSRCGNSLSMTFRCANGIMHGGQLSPLLYNIYADDLNHHLQTTGV